MLAAAVSSDTRYSGLNLDDVAVSNRDDDSAGFIVSIPSGSTSEAGDNATFTVRLTSQPSGTVVITVASNKTTEATVSPTSLSFDASNWSTAKTVTASGVNDSSADGDQRYLTTLTVNSGSTTATE